MQHPVDIARSIDELLVYTVWDKDTFLLWTVLFTMLHLLSWGIRIDVVQQFNNLWIVFSSYFINLSWIWIQIENKVYSCKISFDVEFILMQTWKAMWIFLLEKISWNVFSQRKFFFLWIIICCSKLMLCFVLLISYFFITNHHATRHRVIRK